MMEALISPSSSFGALILVKSTVLLGLLFALALLARKSSASTQHYLWTLGFLGLLTLPIVSYVSVTHEAVRIPLPVPAPASSEPKTDRTSGTVSPEPTAPPSARTREVARDASSAEDSRSGSTPEMSSLAWPSLGYLVWFLGSGALGIRLVAGISASRRLKHRSRPIRDEAWLDLLGDAQARIGTLSSVELRATDASTLPMTTGIFEPTILLPETAGQYSHERRWAVLCHELAHVRRRDCLTQLLCQAACALFWWHPLAWLGARRMRTLSERASDDLVLDAGARPSDYAHDLLDMARGLSPSHGMAPVASVTMAHRTRLEDRLLAILDPAVTRRRLSSRMAVPTAALGAAVLASVALAVPTTTVASRFQEERGVEVANQSEEAAEDVQEPEDPESDRSQDRESRPQGASNGPQDRARAALVRALDDPSPSVREKAIGALVRLEDDRAVPYLLEALGSDDAEIRSEAAWGLGKMERTDAVPELIAALSDESDEVREQATWSLGQIESDDAVEALGLVVMQDRSSNARAQAAWALGQIESAEAVDALVAAILDENENVRSQAVWALGQIQDARALPGLSKALQDDSVDVREQAVWALGMLESPDSLDVLVNALGDPSPEIRSQAAWALGKIGDARAVDALSAALGDENEEVREQAAWALGRLVDDGDGDSDIDLDVDMDIQMELELDDVNPNSNSNSNPDSSRP